MSRSAYTPRIRTSERSIHVVNWSPSDSWSQKCRASSWRRNRGPSPFFPFSSTFSLHIKGKEEKQVKSIRHRVMISNPFVSSIEVVSRSLHVYLLGVVLTILTCNCEFKVLVKFDCIGSSSVMLNCKMYTHRSRFVAVAGQCALSYDADLWNIYSHRSVHKLLFCCYFLIFSAMTYRFDPIPVILKICPWNLTWTIISRTRVLMVLTSSRIAVTGDIVSSCTEDSCTSILCYFFEHLWYRYQF